jgi:hypothetical protein
MDKKAIELLKRWTKSQWKDFLQDSELMKDTKRYIADHIAKQIKKDCEGKG